MSTMSPQPRWARQLERLALALERPVNRLIGNTRLNPFYHTGTIAVFLLGVVAITGFYLFLFFQYGFDASYEAVLTRIQTPIIARTVRGVHRYASGALVITVLLHAFRMLFMTRFKGPRWLAWLTGIVMTFILWLDGITGYWLIWDQRSQFINEHFITLLERFTPWATAYRLLLLRAELNDRSWPILFAILVLHVLLFFIVAGLFWLHIRHLSRPRWLPEVAWLGGATAVLFIIALLFPPEMLAPANPNQQIGTVQLDPIFLYYLPLTGTRWANWLWGFMWLATLIAIILPWLKFHRQTSSAKITIIPENCTGCTKCARDCPYGAIEMIPREDESGHQLLALTDTSKCVGCGICVGSCDDFYAIALADLTPKANKREVEQRLARAQQRHPDKPIKLIFTCQRHAVNGAAPYLEGSYVDGLAIEVIPLTCSGAIQPSLLPHALAQGAAEVTVVGCPPFDCRHQMGNMLEEQRVTNERVPRLRQRYDHSPITAAWLPPDDFGLAVPPTIAPPSDEDEKPSYLSGRAMIAWVSWQNLLIGMVLLTAVLLIQTWFTGLTYVPPQTPPPTISLTLVDPAGSFWQKQGVVLHNLSPYISGEDIQLVLQVDDKTVWQRTYTSAQFFAYQQTPFYDAFEIETGTRHIQLYWQDKGTTFRHTIREQTIMVQAGDIVRLSDLK